MSETALDGVRVLEYCNFISGPYCAKLLADLGAEVIKIEKPVTGDEARQKGPFPEDIAHPERSGLFLYLNTNKMGITLNPETPAGKKIFTKLVKDTDILIEDTTPGTMECLGLGYKFLKEVNPSIIMTSITPYGQTGPYREYKAQHLNVYHMSGQAHFAHMIKLSEGQAPVKSGGYVGDYDAGLSGAVATMAALYKRNLSGTGQQIDVSRQEAMISLDRVDMGYVINDTGINNAGGRLVGGLMPCKDGYVVVVAPLQHQWEALVKLMGNPEWALGEKCRDEFTRADNAVEIQPLIEEWMLQHTMKEIYHRGQEFGCPVGPVNTAEDIFNSPQMKEREFFVDIEHPEIGRVNFPSASYIFSETPWQVTHAAPLLGANNGDIYSGRLGYSDEDIAKMKAEGTI